MRLTVYTDYVYHRRGDVIYAERAFALFLAELASSFEELTIVGRLAPGGETARYALPRAIRFVPLPYYESLTRPIEVLRATYRSMARFRRVVDDSDVFWLLGPSPFAVAFSGLVLARRKRLVLGVRQDYPAYIRARHPGRPMIQLAGLMLEGAFRTLARITPVIAVGPQIARRYRRAKRLLEINVSLTEKADVISESLALERSYEGERRVLSVGRLDEEKNPLMLADVLARLREDGEEWKLIICGEGPQEGALAARLRDLGVEDSAEIRGYLPYDDGLQDLYRSSHALLHVSWTEGMPQVINEAFAAGLPTIATRVGGIEEAVGPAARLISPGDPDEAARELRAIVSDEALRLKLIRLGREWALERTAERERSRVGEFLSR